MYKHNAHKTKTRRNINEGEVGCYTIIFSTGCATILKHINKIYEGNMNKKLNLVCVCVCIWDCCEDKTVYYVYSKHLTGVQAKYRTRAVV